MSENSADSMSSSSHQVLDLISDDEEIERKEQDQGSEEDEEGEDTEEKMSHLAYDIRTKAARIRHLLSQVNVDGISKSNNDKAPRVCVLGRFPDEILTGLWEVIKDNHTKLETEEHKAKGVSPCWIWKSVPGIASLENGYPVLSYRKSLSKTLKLPYLKVHQLAAFIGTGKRCGLGAGSASVASPVGSRKKAWRLVASHLCHNKRCINPDHLWPEANGWNADRGKCRQGACLCKGYTIGGKQCLLSYKV